LKKKAGYVILVVSFMLYAAALALPFTGLSGGHIAALITAFIISAEIFFLLSIYMLGRELVKKYRAYLNPINWFNKPRSVTPPIEDTKKLKQDE
jgi:hypothetical protein